MTTIQIQVPYAVLKAAALFASKDPGRYHLTGVCIDRLDETNIRVRATDGCRLFEMKCTGYFELVDSGESDPVIVPMEIIKFVRKPAGTPYVLFTVRGGASRTIEYMANSGITFAAKLTDSRFPTTHQIWPKGKLVQSPLISMQPGYMADCMQALHLISPTKNAISVFSEEGDGRFGVQIVATQEQDLLMAVMPVNINGCQNGMIGNPVIPEWARGPKVEAKADTENREQQPAGGAS